MLKYLNTQVTFSEVPDEITLCINITGCKIGCKNCHSPYLAEDIGEELTCEKLEELIQTNNGITCIAFMGGDKDPMNICSLAGYIKSFYPNIKVAWYSGRQELPKYFLLEGFDYLKLGPYIEELGPLNNPNTNQQMFEVVRLENGKYDLLNITYKFWK
jgi:anaerobic ribonucleoside-triphosphate reductase activating protein